MRLFPLPEYAIVFVATLFAVLILTPLAILLARKLGVVDRPSPQKFHTLPTPYLGGIAVLVAVLGGTLAPGSVRTESIVIVAAAGILAAIGAWDDWRTVHPVPKLLVQSMAAVALWVVGVRVTPFGLPAIDFAITVFVVLAVVNSLNLLDNMDGLASGTAAIAAGFLFVIAFSQGQAFVALLCAALTGACLGFLPYNLRSARVFLGDAGTLSIGFLLATAAIKINLPHHSLLTRAAIPWLILAVPLFDTSFVIASRLRGRRPVFQGATDHSSHRLVALGATPHRAAMVTYFVGILGGGLALAVYVLNNTEATLAFVAAAVAVAALLGFLLERVQLGVTGELVEAGPVARSGVT